MQSIRRPDRTHVVGGKHLTFLDVSHHKKRPAERQSTALMWRRPILNPPQRFFGGSHGVHQRPEFVWLQRKCRIGTPVRTRESQMFFNERCTQGDRSHRYGDARRVIRESYWETETPRQIWN